MPNRFMLFFDYPTAVRYALGLLLAGWLSLYAFLYHINSLFPDRFTSNEILRLLILGIGICYCVFKIKPWARKLCLFFNVGIISINIFFLAIRLSAIGMTSPALSLHALLNVVIFGLATRYLLIKDTAEFYKAREPKKFDENGKEIL